VKQEELPKLDPERFAARLIRAGRAVSGESFPNLSTATLCALHAHYTELRRWNRRLALIGSGTVREVIERHYAESLAALPLLPPPKPSDSRSGSRSGSPILVDLGSGAGFPGWVLAAARPDLVALLVEARERKWAFLQAATRRAEAALRGSTDPGRASGAGSWPDSLPIDCLNARVDVPLPEALPSKLDIVTVRALKLDRRVLAALARRVTRQGRFLLWLGAEVPRLPPELTAGRELSLGGSEHRRILELVPTH